MNESVTVTMRFTISVEVPAEQAARTSREAVGREIEKMIEINSENWIAEVEATP